MIEISPAYDAKQYEEKWLAFWLDRKLFRSVPDPAKKPYTVLMPPPNVTSQLHMGHGTGYTVQDLMIRWKRMLGYNACWLPGTDHAAIATQMMVEKQLVTEGTSRQAIGREAFLRRCEEWKDKYGGIIISQVKRMGFSCDWDRLAYTMDPGLNHAVCHVFVKLYEEGLIYRGERLVNWDCKLGTAISDDEIENLDQKGTLWHFRYPVKGTGEFITIATTRPETMLGDTAVAVHPEDERYRHLVGKKVVLPLVGREIPIVADDYVKSEFGSGAVKITPAHDPNDFDLGQRHGLPMINILNRDGTLNNEVPAQFRGLDRFVARKAVVKEMAALELLDKEEPHALSVPASERSGSIIEPMLSKQWFLNVKDMAKAAGDAVRDGRIKLYPSSWEKTYLYWLDNVRDWCISRQLWWGHRIPIWYCGDCGHTNAGVEGCTACAKCGSKNLTQDDDVLDTWFSSWLWPLSPFGWPAPDERQKKDLDYYYPTDLLVTGPDIIFLWVARMVMAGLKFRGEIPFKDVYFNAIVCDKQGRKFSKTLGNGIDPFDVIEEFGADAVRFTVGIIAPLGGRIRMARTDFETGSRFVNKLWNSARFLFRYLDTSTKVPSLKGLQLSLPNQWLLTELAKATRKINEALGTYRIHEAMESLYHLAWSQYCDWGLECLKVELETGTEAEREAALAVAVYTFEAILRLAHPIMPFITEELWQKLPAHPDWPRGESIVNAAYPDAARLPSYPESAERWQVTQDVITAIRSLRNQAQVPPRETVEVVVEATESAEGTVKASVNWIKRLATVHEVKSAPRGTRVKQALVQIGREFTVYLPVAGRIDVEAERKRLAKELERISKLVEGVDKKLADERFLQNAGEDVVGKTRDQRENLMAQVERLRANIENL